MLTKNFYNAVIAGMAGKQINNALRSYDGTVYPAYSTLANVGLFMYNLSVTTGISTGVRIGKGVTPPTQDDYTIENQITSGITVTTPSSLSAGFEDGCIVMSCTYGLTNTGTTAVSISEICLFGYFNTTNTSNQKLCMVDRTVLESPITIKPDESKQVTYSIRFNYPVE